MQNQTDTATNQAYEVTPPPIQAGQAPRPPVAQGRRDFFDDPRRKSPVLALVLSLMPGLGQVYIGYYQQGFTNVLVAASVVAVLNSELVGGAEPLFGFFLAFFWLYNMIDAVRLTGLYNDAVAGFEPEDLRREPGSQPYALTRRDGNGEIRFGGGLEYHGMQVLVTYEHGDRWPLPTV